MLTGSLCLVRLSDYLSDRLGPYLSVRLPICLFTRLSVYPPICLSVPVIWSFFVCIYILITTNDVLSFFVFCVVRP